MVRYFKGLMESGAFRPLIDRGNPLGQIVEAYRYVETAQIGNVVISVGALDLVKRASWRTRRPTCGAGHAV
jgi:hypothetical protein